MNLIVAVDKNWGIGKNNNLLDHIPEDMKFFRETTKGKAVIMGKNTFLSFPNQKPLPNRLNIVLTHDKSFAPDGVVVCDDLEKAVKIAKESYADEDIFIIGGDSVYRQGEPLCKIAYITKIEKAYDADRFMVKLDQIPDWQIEDEKNIRTEKGLALTFVKYVRK